MSEFCFSAKVLVLLIHCEYRGAQNSSSRATLKDCLHNCVPGTRRHCTMRNLSLTWQTLPEVELLLQFGFICGRNSQRVSCKFYRCRVNYFVTVWYVFMFCRLHLFRVLFLHCLLFDLLYTVLISYLYVVLCID